MNKRVFTFVILLCLITVNNVYAFDLREAIKQARIGDKMIKTVKGKITFAFQKEKTIITYRYVRKYDKLLVCMEETNPTEKSTCTKLFEDRHTTTYTLVEKNDGHVYKTAFINDESSNLPMFTPFIYSYFISRRGIADILGTGTMIMPGSGVEISDLKYHETITSDGMEVVILRSSVEDGASLELHLCPGYRYRPVKMTNKDKNGVTAYTITCTYNEIEDGLYFPEKVTVDLGQYGTSTMHYAHNETQINPPLTDDDFTIDIPDDVKINDHRK